VSKPLRPTQGKPKVIAIIGPTSSGKSALGVYLAQKLKGEVVSADSRQVYKGLDIGTGKVTKKEMAGIPHHLLDVASPKRRFTADEFVKAATKACAGILQNTRVPIIVGGTGFYIDGLLGRTTYAPVAPNPALRDVLAQRTPAQLLAQLRLLDPRRAAQMDPHNKVRLIRAIEIAKALGTVPAQKPDPQYDVLWLGLNPKDLDARIGTRLRARLKAGMRTEAKRLHARGLSWRRMEELGLEYRYLARLLQGKMDRASMEDELLREIRHYAKRQMRWFKRNPDIQWVSSKAEALRLAREFLRD
jgi:tRNA dimethylallyltransferase